MINVSLPVDIQQFVSETVAEGQYANEQEVVTDAIRFLRDAKIRQKHLRKDIEAALAEVDGGLGFEIESDEALTTFFDELEAEVHTEIAAEKKSRA